MIGVLVGVPIFFLLTAGVIILLAVAERWSGSRRLSRSRMQKAERIMVRLLVDEGCWGCIEIS